MIFNIFKYANSRSLSSENLHKMIKKKYPSDPLSLIFPFFLILLGYFLPAMKWDIPPSPRP